MKENVDRFTQPVNIHFERGEGATAEFMFIQYLRGLEL